jgi:hypothetical protein
VEPITREITLIPRIQDRESSVAFRYYQIRSSHNIIIFARLFTKPGRNPTQMPRHVTKRSRRGVKGGRNGFIGNGASPRIVSRASMSVNRGGDYVQGLVQIGKAREKGPLAAALPLDIPHEGIDRSPPQETSNDTVHGAGNNFPILDAPTTRSNRNFRSTGGLGIVDATKMICLRLRGKKDWRRLPPNVRFVLWVTTRYW